MYFTSEEVDAIVPSGTRSVCLFATHRAQPDLCPNAVEYARQLGRHFELVVMLTNTRQIGNKDDLPPGCKLVFVPNMCLDFGMWSRVLRRLKARSLRRLGLVNDSCYILGSLDPAFETARAQGWRFWGMCRSEEIAPHVQSFFVVLEAEAVPHGLRFFKRDTLAHCARPGYSKTALVRDFEVGLSRHMAARFEPRAVYSMDSVLQVAAPKDGFPNNVATVYWDALLLLGCPLLKKTRVPGVVEAREWMRARKLRAIALATAVALAVLAWTAQGQ